MIPSRWYGKKSFYLISSILCMAVVIGIARTSLFYLCYLPLIFAAIKISKTIGENRTGFTSTFSKISTFIAGMIICELLYSTILVAGGELLFMDESTEDWQIVGIELLLGIFVFLLFIGISSGWRYIKFSFRTSASANNKGKNL